MTKLIFIIFLYLPLLCFSQADCGEDAGSQQKLLVFIGQKIEVTNQPSEENASGIKTLATYKIIEKICGDYNKDTITFEVSSYVDSNFKTFDNILLLLVKDKDYDYSLTGNEYYDVYKTKNGRWASPMKVEDHSWSIYYTMYSPLRRKLKFQSIPKSIRPSKIEFQEDIWYDISDFTRERIDCTYPAIFYRYEGAKAIPVYGNYVSELFEINKRGVFSWRGIYKSNNNKGLEVQDVDLVGSYESGEANEIQERRLADSVIASLESFLEMTPFSDSLIFELFKHCRNQNNYSSCLSYFEKLQKKYPDSVNTYLLTAKYLRLQPDLEDTSKICVLMDGLVFDNDNFDLNYQLAICYYNLFLNYPSPYYAQQARSWFIKAAEIDTLERGFLKYPIIQLSSYLKDSNLVLRYSRYNYQVQANENGVPVSEKRKWYFPSEILLNLNKGWETDSAINHIYNLKSLYISQNIYSDNLVAMNEPLLSTRNSDVYRFLWLRSFDVPVSIRLERTGSKIMLYWKMPNYNSKLDKLMPYKDGNKKLSIKVWNRFEKKLDRIDFWSMSLQFYKSGATDGSIWLLEAHIGDKYKVVERDSYDYPQYTDALMYLLKKSNLHIAQKDIY